MFLVFHSISTVTPFFLDIIICAWCSRMCGEIQTSRWNETCHEGIDQTGRVFIRSLGDEEHMELINRVVVECQQKEAKYEWSYAMMRASGRSILRKCCVWEHDSWYA